MRTHDNINQMSWPQVPKEFDSWSQEYKKLVQFTKKTTYQNGKSQENNWAQLKLGLIHHFSQKEYSEWFKRQLVKIVMDTPYSRAAQLIHKTMNLVLPIVTIQFDKQFFYEWLKHVIAFTNKSQEEEISEIIDNLQENQGANLDLTKC